MYANRKSLGSIAAIATIVLVGAAFAGQHGDAEMKMKMKDVTWQKLPEKVQKTIRSEAGDHEVQYLQTAARENGDVVYYDAVWRDGDQAVSVEVGPDGKLMNRQKTMWSEHVHRMQGHDHDMKDMHKQSKSQSE